MLRSVLRIQRQNAGSFFVVADQHMAQDNKHLEVVLDTQVES